MLNELNSITRDLLGLHGYPTAAPRQTGRPPQKRCMDEAEAAAPARPRVLRKVLVLAKVALGPSAMGHVHW